ncbi:MAG: response regulator transcription factor [Anaerolineales bacterium]|nr:response regulator transcription factor [Anaerolineales bacterium]
MNNGRILIVEDDFDIANMLQIYFAGQGYQVEVANRGNAALDMTRRQLPDLVILDIMLPDMDGYEICRVLRTTTRTSHIPIIFLTQKDERGDRIEGLELGADDYITKPFNVDVLLARMKAVLRRVQPSLVPRPVAGPITIGDLVIDASTHTVTIGGAAVELTAREFGLLHALALRPGHVFSVDELLPVVWGAEFLGESQVVYVHIRRLREKVELEPSQPTLILTVPGIGYRLVA